MTSRIVSKVASMLATVAKERGDRYTDVWEDYGMQWASRQRDPTEKYESGVVGSDKGPLEVRDHVAT